MSTTTPIGSPDAVQSHGSSGAASPPVDDAPPEASYVDTSEPEAPAPPRDSQAAQGSGLIGQVPPSGSTSPPVAQKPPLEQSSPPAQQAPPATPKPPVQQEPPATPKPPVQQTPPATPKPPVQQTPPATPKPPAQPQPPARPNPPVQQTPPPAPRPPAKPKPPVQQTPPPASKRPVQHTPPARPKPEPKPKPPVQQTPPARPRPAPPVTQRPPSAEQRPPVASTPPSVEQRPSRPGRTPKPHDCPTQTGGGSGASRVRLDNRDRNSSIRLTSETGTMVEVFGDPHVRADVNGVRRTFDIGYGPGRIGLKDGTVITWDTFANRSRALRDFRIDAPGRGRDNAVSTADGKDVRGQLTNLTDAQLREFIHKLSEFRGDWRQPLKRRPGTGIDTSPSKEGSSKARHVVQRGDTLFAIARKAGLSVQQVAQFNGIRNPDLIHPGQVIRLPG